VSAAQEAYVNAREHALRAALDSLRAERGLLDNTVNVLASGVADAAFCLAARDLARAVDELPDERKPKGWRDAP